MSVKKPSKKTTRGLLCLGAAAAAFATAPVALPALAQSSGPAPSASSAGEMEEIIVTARRREESLQDVPVSVSAFTGETLDVVGAPDITTLQQITPNLTLQVARGSNSTLIAFIRGVGQQDPLWGFEPGVGLYVDDVYVARPQGAVLDIFDIERIEVLRGPQGTLYGRNTIGGAIKYVTKRIGDEAEGKARLNIGSYNQRDAIASFATPIGDKFGIGGALAVYRRDGFGKNLNTGAEHYNKEINAGRLSLEFKPTESLFFRLSGDKTDDRSNARHGHRELPGVGGVPAVLSDVYDTNSGLGDDNDVETKGVSLTGEWEVNDIVTLKSITAYRKGDTLTNIDFDNTPSPTLDVPAFYKDDQFTQEIQALFTADRWQGVAGIFYLDASASGAFDTILGALNTTIATSGKVDTESWAGFADLSYDVTDQFSVSVGARYTQDDKEGTVFRANYTGIRSPLLGGTPRNPVLLRTNYTNDKSFDQFTPRVSATFEANDDLTLYASFGKGFKSGGFDMRGDAIFTPNTVNGYEPEKVDSYEVGVKGKALDNRLTFNLAGFYSQYDGQQVTTQVAATNGIASFVDNVGNSRIWGVELEGAVFLTEGLSATYAVGYTNADFKEFLQYDLVTQRFIDVADQRVFQNTPKWNGNVGLTYNHDLADNNGTLTFSGSAAYRSKYSLFEIPNPALDQGSYWLLDAGIVWTSASDTWRVGLHGKNLGDKQYRVGGYNFPGAAFGNSIIGYYGPPRTYTVSLEVRF